VLLSVYLAAATACKYIIEGAVGKGKDICWWIRWLGVREGGEVGWKGNVMKRLFHIQSKLRGYFTQ